MSRVAIAALIASTTLVACDTKTEEFTYTTHATAPITEVIVDVDNGSVHAAGGFDSTGAPAFQVKATAVAQWYGERPTVEFKEEGSVLRINALCGQTDNCEIDLSFTMPPGAILRVDGSKTDVEAESIDGPATIETVNGDLTLTKLGGPLEVSVRHGAVLGRGLKMALADVQTFEGNIDLEFTETISSIITDTVNGDIRISVPTTSYLVEAKSGDGTVEIHVPPLDSMRRFIHAIATESGNIWIGPPA